MLVFKRKNRISAYKNSFKLFGYAIKFAKDLFIWKLVWTIIKIIKTILLDVWLLKYVIDAITGGIPFREVVVFIIVCSVVTFVEMYIDDWISEYVQPVAKSKIHGSVHRMIFQKILSIDIKSFDDAEFYNNYVWSLDRAEEQIVSCFNNYMNLLASILSIVSMLTIIISVNPVTVIFAVIPMIAVAVFGHIHNKLDISCATEINPITRRKNYSRRVFYLKQYAQELRSSRISEALFKNFTDSVDEEISIQKRYAIPKMLITILKDSSYGFAQMLGLYLYIAYEAIVKKVFTVGTCAAIINAVDRLTGYFYLFSTVLLGIQRNGMYANAFFDFLKYDSEIELTKEEDNAISQFEILSINNVSFSYPNSLASTLNGISIQVRRGEKIALVGLNGAGKSTLVKLLMRLYDPQDGTITYNGKNIKNLSVKNYRKKFSTIFQDSQIFAVNLIENIIMKCSNNIHADEESKVRDCLERANIRLDQEQLYKNVTKEYDNSGLEFSGGQKQKIAIARALYSDGEIIIMDEASAALDPISENEINNLILREASNKTILIITHRLTTVNHVDKIYYMENGTIVEEGTHEELIALKGRYARMYHAQAHNYQI